MSMKALGKARKIVATIVFIAFALLFCSVPIPGLENLAAVQIGPAILAGSVVFLLVQALVAGIFGRVYCSLLCPLGITQDIIGLLRKKCGFKPRSTNRFVRFGILAIFAASLLSGYLVVYNAIDPYSAFGRIANVLFAPLFATATELFVRCANFLDFPIAIHRDEVFTSWAVLVVAASSLALLIWFVLKDGREWCNYCPVGTLLGFFAQKSLFRIRLDEAKCVSCGICQKNCKTGCIDIHQKKVTNERCVACLECVAICPKNALTYSTQPFHEAAQITSSHRGSFISSLIPGVVLAGIMASEAQAAEKKTVQREEKREPPQRQNPIIPPGSVSMERYLRHCIGCQLCVSACPNNVLISESYSSGLLQPVLSFERGYCRPNCNKCGELCPAGAIQAFSVKDKPDIRLGLASITRERCIINRDKLPCTACQRICPQEAISLKIVSDADNDIKQPFVDAEKCIGCGACEYVCPSRPIAAIAVNGFEVHKNMI